jgi:phosphoglycerate kinase
MANTFLAAQGKPVGKSLCENDLIRPRAISSPRQNRSARDRAAGRCGRGAKFAAHVPSRVVPVDEVGAADMILDIGPRSIEQSSRCWPASKRWSGTARSAPSSIEPFDNGTIEVAEAAAELTAAGRLVSFAGGGDTVAALNVAGVTGRFTYVSTAGGAFLEWLEGKTLPGVEVLKMVPDSRCKSRKIGME